MFIIRGLISVSQSHSYDFVRLLEIMQPVKLGNNDIRNSCFTMKLTYFAGAICHYFKEAPLFVHMAVVIFSTYEREEVDL